MIWTVEAPPGRIGIMGVPRSAEDIGRIVDWDAGIVLSMTTAAEMPITLSQLLSDHGIGWEHLPIPDWGAPPEEVQALWRDVGPRVHAVLDDGKGVIVHCRGGCGRSGMMALRVLIERGEAASKALARIRKVRPCAVETDAQYSWAASV